MIEPEAAVEAVVETLREERFLGSYRTRRLPSTLNVRPRTMIAGLPACGACSNSTVAQTAD